MLARSLTLIVAVNCFGILAFTMGLAARATPPIDDVAKPSGPHRPGIQSDGRTLLPNQWSLQPAGKQINVGDFPVNIALHPSRPYAAVLQCGYGPHEIVVLDLKKNAIVARTKLPEAFYGLAFDARGDRLFVSGGQTEQVHEYTFADGQLNNHRERKITADDSTGVPTGIACSHGGERIFVADGWGDRVAIAALDDPKAKIERVSFDRRSYPYAVCPTADDKRLYVSLWGRGAVAVVDVESKKVADTWAVGEPGVNGATSHPTEMALSPDEKTLYVACSNSNSVVVVDTATGRALEQICSALYPGVPSGSTPNSLALSADGKVLLIANADNNNIAVIDVGKPGQSRSLGFIPVGWYPTSVRFSADGRKIFVANGKGARPKANPNGPDPSQHRKKTFEYIGGLLDGTVSVIDAPSPAEMANYSQQARRASPLRGDLSSANKSPADGNPIPDQLGDSSPIKHCIYIIKENRTYDQVFGDIKTGNGDPKLCIFGQKVTPNLHALVNEFVLLDNFYAEAEVSADGHEWSTAAYATDFVEKTWPLVYRGSSHPKLNYPSEGGHLIALPAAGYIWDRCQQAGITYRSYGEFIDQPILPGDKRHAAVKSLEGHFDPDFHGWDLSYPDNKRTDRFVEELQGFEKAGAMPQFIVLRLPNDHTSGAAAGKHTPVAMVAENDLAVGRLIEAVSHSKFWPETAIFIIEDDAQNGSDHVDAHRTTALAISPYCKRHAVDSTLYSTTSMLRTMELILGLKPLSQFDAAATAMNASFQAKPDLAPFTHLPPESDIGAINKRNSVGAVESSKMDFSREDAADDIALNRVIWQTVRPNETMPPPVHAAFVRSSPKPPDDDD